MKNLGNIDGRMYYSDTQVVEYITHFAGRGNQGRVLCPTAGDGAIAANIGHDYLHVNDISDDVHKIDFADTITQGDICDLRVDDKFDLIIDNLPMYVVERGRNVCTRIIKHCYYNLLDMDVGRMIVTVPHNFYKKKCNRELMDDIPHISYLVTKKELPHINWDFYILILSSTDSNKNKEF